MLNRTAGTQYNDWIGGAAFDDAELKNISDYARSAGIIQANENIFGFDASYSPISSEMMVTISYSELSYDELKDSGVTLSKKDFDLPLTDFFELFKRANFAVARKGL